MHPHLHVVGGGLGDGQLLDFHRGADLVQSGGFHRRHGVSLLMGLDAQSTFYAFFSTSRHGAIGDNPWCT
jgi:hypothetical protein